MAKLGGIPITDSETKYASGAAFLLTKTSQIAEKIQIRGDAFLEVKPDVSYVIVRFNNNVSTPDDTLKHGHEFAQQGLDLLSILGKEHLAIRDADDEHIIWWRQNEQQILRMVVMEALNFETNLMQATVLDKAGNEIKPPVIEPNYHYAFRYFRLSQITEDLYDAYRNMYLAFELLLSSKYPKNKGREIDWLKESLNKVNTSLDILTTSSMQGVNTIESIIKTIYYDARLPLFHAKQGHGFYPPQSSQYQLAVKKAHKLLTKLVLRMSEVWYNARYQRGGGNPNMFFESITKLLSKAKILLSEDNSPPDLNQADLNHSRYKTAIRLNTELQPNNTFVEKEPILLGKLNIDKIGNNISVRRIEVVDEKKPISFLIMKDELNLSGIDQLECQFSIRINNVRQPKNLYPR